MSRQTSREKSKRRYGKNGAGPLSQMTRNERLNKRGDVLRVWEKLRGRVDGNDERKTSRLSREQFLVFRLPD